MPPAAFAVSLRRSAGLVVAAIRSIAHAVLGRHLWAVGLVLALLGLACTGVILRDSHRQAVAQAGADLRGLGIVLAEQTSRYVQTIDLVVQQTQMHVADLRLGAPDAFAPVLAGEELHRYLAGQATGLSPGHGIALFDAAGELVNTSRPVPLRRNVAERTWFRQLRDYPRSGAAVGEVTPRGTTGDDAFVIARRIAGPDGAFLGAVATAVDVDDLYRVYAAIDNERRLEVTLRRRDGLLLVHYPTTGSPAATVPAEMTWFETVTRGGGIYRRPDETGAANRIMSVNPASDYPLVIDVAVAEANMLQPWRDQAIQVAAFGTAFSVFLLAIFVLLGHQMRRQRAQHATLARTTDMLRENEARLSDFSSLASDWFWEQDAGLRFVSMGRDHPRRPGDQSSLIGKLPWEADDSGRDPQRWEEHRQTLLAHLPFRDFRFEQLDGNGRALHLSVSGVPLHDRDGRFVGYRGIGRNITAEVELEQDLRRAKERAERAEGLLQDALDSVLEGFAICDADGRQVTCNEAYRRLYRYQTGTGWAPGSTSEAVLRRGMAEGRYPETVGQDQAWCDAWLQRTLAVPSATERLLADGRWLLVTRRRMRNGGVAVLLVDITALKQTQAALADSETRLERAQEIGRIGSWELDIATGELVWSRNLYRMRGLPPDFKPTLATIAERVDPPDSERIMAWFADLAAGRQRDPLEVRVRRPDGTEHLHLLEARPVVDRTGVVRRVAGTSQDVTERRTLERSLAQSQKMDALGQLTGGMAHDFNNILGIIIGNLDLLTPLLGNEPLAGELCAEARDGAARCAELIRRLLAFARRQSLRPEQADVNALIRDTAHLLGRTLGENIVLTLELGRAPWPVQVDVAQLEAALINLATNARDAMPKGGELTIATRNIALDAFYAAQHPDVRAGDYLLIEVRDTGTGIAPGIINRIFDPFFTTKAPGQGTGLGLSMLFGFVKQSGGHVSVYSECGLGASFRLYLPRSDHREAALPGPADSDVIVGGTESVVLVEDNAQLRRVAARQLEELGYAVRQADSAAAALAILAGADHTDLLFSDVVMPGGMDGVELAREARRLRPDLKILLTSGFPGDRGTGGRVSDSPSFRMLGKPYSFVQLAQAVRMVLDGAGTAAASGDPCLAASGHESQV